MKHKSPLAAAELARAGRFAEITARKAGAILVSKFARFKRSDMRFKGPHNIFTPADLAAERFVISAIHRAYPRHAILAEESGRSKKQSDFVWTIDPLDGTSNFAYQSPMFGTMLALTYRGVPLVCAIYLPFIKQMFTAVRGKGAYENGKRIHVSSHATIAHSFTVFCYGHTTRDARKEAEKFGMHMKQHGFDARHIGSAAVEFGWVARGSVDIFRLQGASAWDIAPGLLLVEEAGGVVTDLKGKPWTLESGGSALATNGKIHKKVLQLMRHL